MLTVSVVLLPASVQLSVKTVPETAVVPAAVGRVTVNELEFGARDDGIRAVRKPAGKKLEVDRPAHAGTGGVNGERGAVRGLRAGGNARRGLAGRVDRKGRGRGRGGAEDRIGARRRVGAGSGGRGAGGVPAEVQPDRVAAAEVVRIGGRDRSSARCPTGCRCRLFGLNRKVRAGPVMRRSGSRCLPAVVEAAAAVALRASPSSRMALITAARLPRTWAEVPSSLNTDTTR